MNWWHRYVGQPYVKGGRSPDKLDCWGGVLQVYADQWPGVALPEYGAVTVDEMQEIALSIATEKLSGTWRDVIIGDERSFDVCVMPVVALGRMGAFHVGVITRPGHVLHWTEDAGCIESCFRRVENKSPDRLMRFIRCEIFRHKMLA